MLVFAAVAGSWFEELSPCRAKACMAGYSLLSSRKTIAAASLLIISHAVVLTAFGTRPPGPLLSDLAQLAVGIFCIWASFQASRRSTRLGRYFWQLAALSFVIWVVAQTLTTYDEAFRAPISVEWLVNILFFFWFTPLGMAVFLDPDYEPKGFDLLLVLDITQAVVFVAAAYLYFFYLPSRSESGTELAHTVWEPYFIYSGSVTGAFLLRAFSTNSAVVRSLFGRMAFYFLASTLADYLYFYGPGKDLQTGTWFDIIWSLTLVLPLGFAATWDSPRGSKSVTTAPVQAKNAVVTQLFPLLYPFFVLLMSARIAQERVALASIVVLVSFACSSSRLLMTQHRQQRSTAALERTHGLLHAIIEGTSDAIFVKDLQGRYVMINAAGAKLLGHSVEEVSGKDDRVFFSPETAHLIMEKDRQVMLSGQPQTYEEAGEAAGVKRTYLSTKAPHRDTEGNVIGLIGISVDITEHKRAEDSLAQSEERFRSVFQESPIGIIVMDMDGRAIAINSAYRKMLELGDDEPVSNQLLNELTFPENRHVDDARYHQLASGTVDHDQQEKRYLLRSGRNVWAELNLLLLRDSIGQPQYVMIMALDITERKRLEEQLRQAQKMEAIGTLSGGIAHDFNNLLTVIKGYSRIVMDSLQKGSQLQMQVERIDEAAERAAALTRQLLAFSRRQVLQPRVFNINSLVGNLDKMLRRLIGEDVEMVTVTARDLGCVKADPGQIEQVIMNLVVNARDAMPKGGKLTLETSDVHLDENYALARGGIIPGPYVMLAVSDTGAGMDAETQAHIFEPFFTTKEMGKGTGLGLSMVYGIVKQSGGHVSVYSEPGQGTTFKVYLPRVDVASDAAPSEHRAASTIRGTETILLAEDDRGVRDLARAILSACGYSVLEGDSRTALSLCRDHPGPVHLLLTDVVMPGLSGRELADQIRARRPDIKVLYMSGYTSNAIIHHGVLDADTFFLQKPFTPAGLAAKVREVLDHAIPDSA